MNLRKRSGPLARAHNLVLILALVVAICTISTLRHRMPHFLRFGALRSISSQTSCVLPMGVQNNEGLGQTLLRNQFAVYVAELLSARLNFPEHTSHHGYNLADFFDRCGSSSSLSKVGTPKVPEHCILRKKELFLLNCPRGDCSCLRRETMRYVLPLASRCDVIGVEHDGFKTQEYSGCISNVLKRYFGGPDRWPRPYNAIHYRQGDLKAKHGEHPDWMHMLNNVLSFMCRHSDRDIVIVTQGTPEVPKCENRVVLAGNTSERDSFPIIQHAQWIGVEHSGFGLAMMQISNPERIFMDTYAMKFYDWLTKPEWTVFNSAGAGFSFASGQDALDAKFSGAGLDVRTLRSPALKRFDHFETEVPVRRWEKEALPIDRDG